MNWRSFVFGALCAIIFAATMAQTPGPPGYRQLSTQQALNRLAGATDREYSVQQATNLLVTRRSLRDSLVGMISIIWDDGLASVWDSIAVFDNAGYTIPCGVGVIGYKALHGDTTNTYMSISQLKALYNRGWSMGAHQDANLSTNDVDGVEFLTIYEGNALQSNFDNAVSASVLAIRDTMGFPQPRWWVFPGLVRNHQYKRAVAKYCDIAFSGGGAFGSVAAGNTGDKVYSAEFIAQKTLDIAGNTQDVHVYNGVAPDRYDIGRFSADSRDSTALKAFVLKQVMSKSWGIMYAHVTDTTGWTAGDQIFGGDGVSLSWFVKWARQLVAAGKLRFVTPDEGFDLMFRQQPYYTGNYIHENWESFADTTEQWYYAGLGATPWLMDASEATLNITVYRDSTSTNGARWPGYGGGVGYATLDWTNWGDTWNANYGSNLFEKTLWAGTNCTWRIPMPPGGSVAYFEAYAQIDTSVDTGFAGGDSLWVTFLALHPFNYNSYGTSTNPGWNAMMTQKHSLGGSTDFAYASFMTGGTVSAGASSNLNIINAGAVTDSLWHQISGSWAIPPGATGGQLYVSICKGAGLPSGAVKISRPFLTFYPRNPLW